MTAARLAFTAFTAFTTFAALVASTPLRPRACVLAGDLERALASDLTSSSSRGVGIHGFACHQGAVVAASGTPSGATGPWGAACATPHCVAGLPAEYMGMPTTLPPSL